MIRGLEYLSYEERLKAAGLVRLEEKESLIKSYSDLPVPKRELQVSWRGTCYKDTQL